jgi:hypothetical protein
MSDLVRWRPRATAGTQQLLTNNMVGDVFRAKDLTRLKRTQDYASGVDLNSGSDHMSQRATPRNHQPAEELFLPMIPNYLLRPWCRAVDRALSVDLTTPKKTRVQEALEPNQKGS